MNARERDGGRAMSRSMVLGVALAAVHLVGSETSTLYRQIGQSISN